MGEQTLFDSERGHDSGSSRDDAGPDPCSISTSSASAAPPRVMAWLLPEQVDVLRSLRRAARFDLIAVGGPGSSATATIAEALDAPRSTDFRHEVLNEQPDLIWLLTADGLGAEELSLLMHHVDRPVLALEPLPSGIGDCPAEGSMRHVRFLPHMRSSDMMEVFDDVREAFGLVHSIAVTTRAGRRYGSLFARIADAVDVVEYLGGPVEQFDASISGPISEAPTSLRALHGHLTVNARFAENCCACILASDLGASWSRGITVLGDGGCVRMTDEVFEWWGPDGELLDSSGGRRPEKVDSTDELPFPERLYLKAILSAVDPSARPTPPVDPARMIAGCEAIRLSLRTGQGETPRKIMQMIRSGS